MKEKFDPGERLNEEEALIAAGAEKPVRDLAREESVEAATKEVFDKRAVKRGDQALKAHREKREKLKGLFNPELKELKDQLAAIKKQLEEEFGEDILGRGHIFYPQLYRRYKFNERGELEYIRINDLILIGHEKITGVGPLGKKFEKAANAFGEQELSKGSTGMGKLDQAVLDAYKDDPEVKKLIDRLIELERTRVAHEQRIEDILKEKRSLYEQAEGINSFLERLGISKRVPSDFNADEIRKKLYDLKHQKDPNKQVEYDTIVRIFKRTLSIFDGIVISKEKEDDVKPDFETLASIFIDIGESLLYTSPDDVEKEFKTQMRSIEVGARLLKHEKPLLYTVES